MNPHIENQKNACECQSTTRRSIKLANPNIFIHLYKQELAKVHEITSTRQFLAFVNLAERLSNAFLASCLGCKHVDWDLLNVSMPLMQFLLEETEEHILRMALTLPRTNPEECEGIQACARNIALCNKAIHLATQTLSE